ncbi:amino acid permease [Streptomyces sp. NPDC093707]|uniref:amino acid permease n=1 Tax=Streptomyces sp. NPDC093707 TaxID=3154984 RepID=UPI00344BFE70
MSRHAYRRSSGRTDDLVLLELGYEQQLARRMTAFGNAGTSFTVISILSGCMTMYGFGLATGGPAVMLWGWVAVGAMVLFIGASLAEVTSAYPTSGALYFMAHKLGGKKWGWYTGWLNLLGLVGAIAAVDCGCAQFVSAFVTMQFDTTVSANSTFAIFLVILLLHAVINVQGVRLLSALNVVSVWWHVAGVVVIVGALLLIPSHHQSPAFVFTKFVNGTGFGSTWYVALIGLLLAQYTFSGYDASAHLSEETANAQVAAPRGMLRAIAWSWAAGFVLLAGLTFAIGDYAATQAADVPPVKILHDALGPEAAKALLLVVIVAQLFCGTAGTAAASRMVFAFSRDRALPGWQLWQRVSDGTPKAAVWLSVGAAAVLVLPSLYSATAYGAVTAVNVIGITPAYALPIFLRIRYRRRFIPGPWNLGSWGVPVGAVAVTWVMFVTVLFCLPQHNPVALGTFNYAPVALVMVLALATVWWWLAKRNYSAPAGSADRDLVDLESEVI